MIVFRYKSEIGPKGRVVKRPVADVHLKTSKGNWIEFHPYIDSGADVTLIPLSLGKLIGFILDEEKIEQIGGIRGSIPVLYQEGQIRLGSEILNTKIAWALTDEVPPLLGREGVFDEFKIIFKQRGGIIIFEKRKK